MGLGVTGVGGTKEVGARGPSRVSPLLPSWTSPVKRKKQTPRRSSSVVPSSSSVFLSLSFKGGRQSFLTTGPSGEWVRDPGHLKSCDP